VFRKTNWFDPKSKSSLLTISRRCTVNCIEDNYPPECGCWSFLRTEWCSNWVTGRSLEKSWAIQIFLATTQSHLKSSGLFLCTVHIFHLNCRTDLKTLSQLYISVGCIQNLSYSVDQLLKVALWSWDFRYRQMSLFYSIKPFENAYHCSKLIVGLPYTTTVISLSRVWWREFRHIDWKCSL
jgi:hypothetical protein